MCITLCDLFVNDARVLKEKFAYQKNNRTILFFEMSNANNI